MNKKLASTILFFCLMFGLSLSVIAQSEEDYVFDEDSLIESELLFLTPNKDIYASLKSISVSVSFKDAPLFNETAEKQIKADIETKLRNAGFVIDKNSQSTYLYITAKSEYSGTSLTSFVIEVSFNEKFLLERKQTISKIESIWNRKARILPNSIEKNTLRDTVRNLVDKFIAIRAKSNESASKAPLSKEESKKLWDEVDAFLEETTPKKEDSPFTATYVGGNRPPEVEIFNDTDRTLYIDIGQSKMTAYTIPSKASKTIQLVDGNYNYKAAAPRVTPLQGKEDFKKGYRYTWRFRIITVKK